MIVRFKTFRRLSPLFALAVALGAASPLRAQDAVLVAPADSLAVLSLEAALARAAQVSDVVGIAEAGVLRARGQQMQARADYFPQLTGTASYTRTLDSQFSVLEQESDPNEPPATTSCNRFAPNAGSPIAERVDSLEQSVACISALNPFASFSNLPFGQRNQYNLGLSLSQNLFAGGRIKNQNRTASANRRSAEVELASQRAQVVLDVTSAYFDAVLSDQLAAIADSSLAQTERTLKDVELAKQVGTQPEFELLRAKVTRDNQRPVVIQRRAQRDLAHQRLKQLLDLPLNRPLTLTTTLGDTADTTLALPPGARNGTVADTVLDRRAPVRKAEEFVKAQQGMLGVARAGRLPTLRLTSQFARIAYPPKGLPSWDEFVTDWTVALNLSVPIFTGGRLRGDRTVARANLDEAEYRLAQTRSLASLDATNTASTLAAAEATWEASAGTVQQAQKAYAIAEIRFREGVSTQIELSDSRLLLEQARANRAQAARDLQVARTRAALLRDLPIAIGGASATPAPSAGSTTFSSTTAGSTTTTTTGTTTAGLNPASTPR